MQFQNNLFLEKYKICNLHFANLNNLPQDSIKCRAKSLSGNF